MAIQGSLEEAPLPDVLQLLSLGKKTGCLALTEREMQGEICLDNGLVCHAAVFTRRDRLGDTLVRRGRITQQQLDEAIRLEQGGGRQVSQTLVESGQVERTELEQLIRTQAEEAVYFMFTWRTGSFAFTTSMRPKRQELLVPIDPEGLLLEGARRVDEWSLIEKRIPSLDLIFRLDHARIDAAHALTEEQQRLLSLVDGTRDVNTIIEMTGMAEFDVGKALYGLITAGYARMVDRRATMRHLDYRELLAYVVREAEFAEPEQRRAAARHIADCATCTQRLKTIHVRRTGAISSFAPRPETSAPTAEEAPGSPAPTGAGPATLAPGVPERRAADRRSGAERREDDRRRGEDRRQARSPEWESPGRDRRSGHDRRVDMRRVSERRIGGLGDRQSAAVLAARPLTLPQRSRSGERRVTGPRRLPRRDSGGPATSRRDTGGRIRLQPNDEPVATPVAAPPPETEKPPARSKGETATEPPPEQPAVTLEAATEPAAPQAKAAPEPTVEIPGRRRPEPPAETAAARAAARARPPKPAARRKEPEVPDVPATAAEEETIDLGLGLEPTLLASPELGVEEPPVLGLETTAPPASVPEAAAPDLGIEPTAPPAAEPTAVSRGEPGLEAGAPPSAPARTSTPEETAEVSAAQPAPARQDPEQPQPLPRRLPAKSTDIEWLVSPAEANHLLRTSRVGLAPPTEEMQAVRPKPEPRPKPDAAKPAATARVERAPKDAREERPKGRDAAPAPPPAKLPRPERPSPSMTAVAPLQAVEPSIDRDRASVEPPTPTLGGWDASSGAAVPLDAEPRAVQTGTSRWIGIAAAAVVLIGIGLLAKPLLRGGGTESPPTTPPVARAAPSEQPPPGQSAPTPSAAEELPVQSPAAPVERQLAVAPPQETRTASPAPARETRPATSPPDEQPRAAQPAPARETPPPAVATPPAPAVATIRGNVRDAQSGAAMAGVRISIPGTAFSATTDANGTYTFRDVPAGRVSIAAAAEGRVAGSREVVLQPGGTVDVEFTLEKTAPARAPEPAPAAATPPTPAPVATAPTPREADTELESGGWKVGDVATASATLKTPLATIRGLWIESVATIETVSRPRARIAVLTSSGDRIVLTETRSGAPILGNPRVTAVRIVPPTDAYPVTTGTASFGGLLVTAKATLPAGELEALLMTLVVIE